MAGFAQRFGGMGLGFDHLKPTMQNSSEAMRRRCSSNYMDGILSDPKKWNEAVNNFVEETYEAEDGEQFEREAFEFESRMAAANQVKAT